MRSPRHITNPARWTAYVCRVSFTTQKPNTKVRVKGGCIVLQNPPIRQTSELYIADLDETAVTYDSTTGNVTFGSGTDVARGSVISKEFTAVTAGNHHVDFMFLDADQNIPNGQPATQVWGAIEYVGTEYGSEFTFDYSHGADTSGNDSTASWDIFKLSEVTFSNGTDVKQDNGGGSYPTPHWKRDMAGSPLQPCPYLYGTDSTKKKLRATVKWSYESGQVLSGLQIKGIGTDGINIPATSATVDTTAKTISLPTTGVDATTNFGDETKFFNPFSMDWQMSFDGGTTWESAGTSNNPIYVSLGVDTTVLPLTGLYRTVVHLACSTDGATSGNQAADNAWNTFKGRTIKGWKESDKEFTRNLYYYKPGTTFIANASGETSDLLQSTTDSGQCDTWAELLIDVFAVNGIQCQRCTVKAKETLQLLGMLIKEWDGGTKPEPAILHADFVVNNYVGEMVPSLTPGSNVYGQLISLPAIPGQSSGSNSPSEKVFAVHYIVKYVSDSSTKYLDPSYGVEYTGEQNFQDNAVDFVVISTLVDTTKIIAYVRRPLTGSLDISFSVTFMS
ncbi:MAG: hypothetical protein LBJ00_18275 [Planctomycetaceae bacterium]|nr:hypothetical protein [Planctomycetaceae bacterium]